MNFSKITCPPKEHFESKFIVTPGCWIWVAGKNKHGYGQFYDGESRHRSHRYSYETYVGPISDSLCVCHRCDNPSCVNPDHLFLATNAENTKDRSQKGRTTRQFGEENKQSKLVVEDILKIRKMAGSNSEIAEVFSISPSNVSYIKNRKSWAHVPEEIKQ
jgi:hypothetical protein